MQHWDGDAAHRTLLAAYPAVPAVQMETQSVAKFLAEKFNEHAAKRCKAQGIRVPLVEYLQAELACLKEGGDRVRFMLMVG